MKTRVVAYLAALAIVDALIPVPILALVLLFVIWRRPPWFAKLTRDIYGGEFGGNPGRE